MPLLKPQSGENRSEFISRCVADPNVQNEAADRDQALAICSSIWDERSMSPNEKLLAAIKARGDYKPDPFGYGILTADRYVKSMQDCVGIDACYKFAATKHNSFDDVMRKAANTLVYGNEDMDLEDVFWEKRPGVDVKFIEGEDTGLPVQLELPKNTLLVFKHILTTSKKDRDGDILRTQGAVVDPKMPLLWQHVHTLPIGKMLVVAEHTRDVLSLISVIVDVNDLSHDAAVMVDNKITRYSHGFRALEFSELKEEEGQTTSPGGFDVKRFEIMEASVVSVPSNTDAETEEIILSLAEGGKLTSPVMKSTANGIRSRRPLSVPVDIDVLVKKITGIIEEKTDADEPGDRGAAKEPAACSCTSEKTDDTEEETETVETENAEVELVADYAFDEKRGRVLSAANLKKLKDVKADIDELSDKESDMTRGGKAICERCSRKLSAVIATQDGESDHEMTVKDAMAFVFANATLEDRKNIADVLRAMDTIDENEQRANEFSVLWA